MLPATRWHRFSYDIRGCRKIPACPVFLHAHSLYHGNACPCKHGIDLPTVHEVSGIQAVMADDFPYASVYEHVAYGHQAAGPVDILSYEVVSRIPCMIGQQQPSASAGRVTHSLSGLFFFRLGAQHHEVADMYRSEELSL